MADQITTATGTGDIIPLAYPIDVAATVAGVPRRKIFQAVADQKLTARKAGRSTIVERDELVAWIKSLPTRGKQPEPATAA